MHCIDGCKSIVYSEGSDKSLVWGSSLFQSGILEQGSTFGDITLVSWGGTLFWGVLAKVVEGEERPESTRQGASQSAGKCECEADEPVV